MQLRRPLRGNNEEPGTLKPNQTSYNPVDDVLRPGQELVDTIRRAFDGYDKNESAESWQTSVSGQRVLVSLALTPLSVLLSAYGEILHEIAVELSRGIHPTRLGHQQRLGAKPSLTASASSKESGKYGQQRLGHAVLPPSSSSFSATTFASSRPVLGKLSLSLGEMSLDRSLQLKIVTMVIKHHLNDLEHILKVFETHQIRTCHESPSDKFHLAIFEALGAFAGDIVSETLEIIQHYY